MDACSSTTNHKAPQFFALDHPDPTRRDGLAGDWATDALAAGGAVWMNPVYGRTIGAWMAKAAETARAGATVVCLVPARTDTRWFHDHVLAEGAEVRYVRGRLKFGDATTGAPFASLVVMYRGRPSGEDVGTTGPDGDSRTSSSLATVTRFGHVLPASRSWTVERDRSASRHVAERLRRSSAPRRFSATPRAYRAATGAPGRTHPPGKAPSTWSAGTPSTPRPRVTLGTLRGGRSLEPCIGQARDREHRRADYAVLTSVRSSRARRTRLAFQPASTMARATADPS